MRRGLLRMKGKATDYTGRRFGKLVVLRLLENRKTEEIVVSQRLWLCQCDCGKEITVGSNTLIHGIPESCGCENKSKKDHTGKRFGRLVALERIPKARIYPCGKPRTEYRCLCDCGKEVRVTTKYLSAGNIQSCGCFHKEAIASANRKKPYEGIYNRLVATAKRRNKEISLSYEDFLKFTEQKTCTYCDDSINWTPHTGTDGRHCGCCLDRKNNNLGYTVDNCTVCCGRCNKSKLDTFSYEEWKYVGKAIKEFRERKR